MGESTQCVGVGKQAEKSTEVTQNAGTAYWNIPRPLPHPSPHLSDFHNLDGSQLACFDVSALREGHQEVISPASSQHSSTGS